MDHKTYGIGILTLTAIALLIANLFAPRPVIGTEAVSNDDMKCVTAKSAQGGDALYILDNNTGKLAVFTPNPRGGMQIRTVVDVETGFREAGNVAGGNNKNR
jgi:hypothetical protein